MLRTIFVNFCVFQNSSKMLKWISLLPTDLDKIGI